MSSIPSAVRHWATTPLFSAAVILTLALGIGAVALMFGVIEGVLGGGSLKHPSSSR